MMTLEQFEAALAAQIPTVKPRMEVGLDKVGELASTMAVHYLGVYQEGWPALKPETIASKATGDSPLLETGHMRDSISHYVNPFSVVMEVVVGSTDKHAVFQELGTSRIPPRPFLSLAMAHSLPFAADTFGEIAVSILKMKALT
jgi:phage gpG-like protein